MLPLLGIFNRWVRWLTFAACIAYLAQRFQFSSRPYWVLFSIAFLCWFLLESGYHWFAIQALSHSPLPLFPRFGLNSSGEEWPTQRCLLAVRESLRVEDFHLVQSLKSEIAPNLYLRVSIYHSRDNVIRLQITFVPQANGRIGVCYTISSQTSDGVRYVTDNLHLPFGGFYPETWLVVRKPWTRSLSYLLSKHRKRISSNLVLCPWDTEPLEDLNRQQTQLEQVNTEMGFLNRYAEQEDFGKISQEGRYRIWKEIWLMNYLGRSASYE